MSAQCPIINPAQIDQLCTIVHEILQQNTNKIDDILAQAVDIQNASILKLYQLVVDQWHKKQKIIDNLCHFSLTMMATVNILWQQKQEQQQKLDHNQISLNNLQRQIQQLAGLNEIYRQKISQAENHIQIIEDAKDKIEEFVKSKSCINFSQLIQQQAFNKKCMACQQHKQIQHSLTELISKNCQILAQKDEKIEFFCNQKRSLQKKLSQAIDQLHLTKMQLQLAEIAIKESHAYKNSLVQQNESNFSQIVNRNSNIHYYQGQIDFNSNIDDSFAQNVKNVLSNQFSSKQDIIHFESTPCLLLNQSKEDLHYIQTQIKSPQNPFRKKGTQNAYSSQHCNEEFDEHDTSFNGNFEVWRPQSQKVGQKKVQEIIRKFQLKQSQTSDKQQTQQSSCISNDVLMYKKYQNLSKLQKVKSQISFKQSSISQFYSFITNKIVTSRIKLK